jgi:divalent metal cation (Fe/Co/Zn/Cd) transporter
MTDSTMTVEQRGTAKRSAALTSLLAALGVALLKLLTGVLTGSLGMLSEAAHSGIDLIAAGITLLAVRVSDRPADAEHNYGHGKLESLSAGFEALLMIGSCVWIAVHFGTDIWSSTAVLLGLIASFVGAKLHVPALEYADPIAALVVAGVILWVTWRLARRVLDSLLDATPPELRAEIQSDLLNELQSTGGVLGVERLRVRRSGSDYFVDLTLSLPRNLTFQRSEQITFAATEAVQRRLPGADVVIHTVPTAALGESVFDRIRAVAARSNLAIHDVSVQHVEGALHVEQHLEVPETMSLREAHEIATQLETEMRKEIPGIATLLTHIESEPATIADKAQMEASQNLENQLRETASHFPEIVDVHEITVTRGHGGAANSVQVNCHCTLPDDLPMEAVHEIITNFESEFRLDHPQVSRVLIHPEPATDNRR